MQLSRSLADRCERTRDVADLEEALSAAVESIECVGPGSFQRRWLSHNLGRALGMGYGLTSDPHMLQRSLDAARDAVRTTPKGASRPCDVSQQPRASLDRATSSLA